MFARLRVPLLVCAIGLAVPALADGGAALDHVRKAQAALAEGKPRTARIELLNAIEADPGHGPAHLLQAQTYLLLNDGIAAEAEVIRARQAGVPVDATRHLMGLALAMQDKPQRALAEADPQHVPQRFAPAAARARGRALAMLGDLAAAERAFHEAARLAPRDAPIWTDIARFRMQVNDIGGAVVAINNALALDRRGVEAHVIKGQLTRQQLGLLAAMPWFDRALALDSANVPALVERAATLGDLGRMREMLAASRAILKQVPASPEAFYLQAVLAARAGDFPLARAIMLRTQGALDGNAAVMLLYGITEYQQGNYARAIDQLQRLIARQPDNEQAARLLGAAQWRAGEAGGVIATLQPLADLPQADSYTLMLVGRAYERLGDRARAAVYLDRAMMPTRAAALAGAAVPAERLDALWRTARGGDAWTSVPLIRALLRNGRNEEALQVAIALHRAAGGAPQAHVAVGDVLDTMGRLPEARDAYRRAAALSFTEPVMLRLLSVQRRLGDAKAAYGTLDSFLRQHPQSVPGQILAADYLLGIRAFARAVPIYERLRARLGDRDAMMLNNLAWAYAQTGHPRRALVHAARAYRLAPANPAVADTYGWLLALTGRNPGRGVALLEQAVAQAPRAPNARWHLAQAYARTRQPAKARHAARVALGLPGFADRAAAQALLTRL